MDIREIITSLAGDYQPKETPDTFILIGNDDTYKGSLATRLVGKQVIIPQGASKYITLMVSSDDSSVGVTNSSCFILGTSNMLKGRLHEFDFGVEASHLHIVLLISASCPSRCVTETKTWLDAIYALSKTQSFASCTLILTNNTSLQNVNPCDRKVILKCIRALALVASNKIFPKAVGNTGPPNFMVYTVSSMDDVTTIARYLLREAKDREAKDKGPDIHLLVDENDAILCIPPGTDSHTMICASSSPDEALKLQMDVFLKDIQADDDKNADKEIANLQEYLAYVTEKTKAEDPMLADILAT